MIYRYLTGPEFRHRIAALVEKFNDMREDLDRERKFVTKQWAKREQQITVAIGATSAWLATCRASPAGRSRKSTASMCHCWSRPERRPTNLGGANLPPFGVASAGASCAIGAGLCWEYDSI